MAAVTGGIVTSNRGASVIDIDDDFLLMVDRPVMAAFSGDKAANRADAGEGETLKYTITIANNSGAAIFAPQDPLPEQTTFHRNLRRKPTRFSGGRNAVTAVSVAPSAYKEDRLPLAEVTRMCYACCMHSSLSTRTVCCKLSVRAATDRALTETAVAFNAAASYCAQVAWQQGVTNKNTLHHRVYHETRERFGLGSQLACCARDKAAEAVRAARALTSDTCPAFRPDSSIRYDARTYKLRSLDRVSLNTLHGRVEAQLVLGDFQRRYLYDLSWSIGGAELVKRDGVWYFCLTQSKRNPEPDEATGWIGLDLGIANIATASDGTEFRGHRLRELRKRRFAHRQRLQTANSRRARWRLRQLARKEHRFQKDVNHCISKAIVQQAAREPGALWATLRLEDVRRITRIWYRPRRGQKLGGLFLGH